MSVVFGILSAVCLIYYGIILVYSGIETAFSAIWLLFSLGFALLGVVVRFYGKIRDRIPLRLEVSAVTAVSACFVIFVIVEIAMGFYSFSLKNESADYVIVLGTQVKGDKPSKSLQYRLEKAYDYAAVHPNTVLILSGGQGPDENVSEARAMYDYLRKRGIPAGQMILEENSHSTYENLVYSRLAITSRETERRAALRNVMAEYGYEVPPDEEMTISVGIVTSNFHVLRATGIAKKIGMQNVTGIAAKSDPVLFVHFCVRECFAILKDKFVGNM